MEGFLILARVVLGVGAVILLVALAVVPVLLWFEYAEWVQFDLFTAWAIFSVDPAQALAPSCWPLSIEPIESARCHALAQAIFRFWAETAELGKGTAKMFEWIGDQWLGWWALSYA